MVSLLLLLSQAKLMGEEEARKGIQSEVDKYFGEKLKENSKFNSIMSQMKSMETDWKTQKDLLNQEEDITIRNVQKARQLQNYVAKENEITEQLRGTVETLPKINYSSLI